MELTSMRPGMRVYDRWWPWKVMRVVRVFKTVVRLDEGGELRTYDRAHARAFLMPLVARRKARASSS